MRKSAHNHVSRLSLTRGLVPRPCTCWKEAALGSELGVKVQSSRRLGRMLDTRPYCSAQLFTCLLGC